MATRRKVAFALYLINAVVLLGFGLRYFFARDLMGYHAVTIGAPAASLSDAHQLVFITLYRATGAGMLTVAVTIVVLLLLPFRAGERWSRWALSFTTGSSFARVTGIALTLAVLAIATGLCLWMFAAGQTGGLPPHVD